MKLFPYSVGCQQQVYHIQSLFYSGTLLLKYFFKLLFHHKGIMNFIDFFLLYPLRWSSNSYPSFCWCDVLYCFLYAESSLPTRDLFLWINPIWSWSMIFWCTSGFDLQVLCWEFLQLCSLEILSYSCFAVIVSPCLVLKFFKKFVLWHNTWSTIQYFICTANKVYSAAAGWDVL